MGIRLDESGWPIVVGYCEGTLNEGDLTLALTSIDRWLARNERFGLIIDARNGGALPPEQRWWRLKARSCRVRSRARSPARRTSSRSARIPAVEPGSVAASSVKPMMTERRLLKSCATSGVQDREDLVERRHARHRPYPSTICPTRPGRGRQALRRGFFVGAGGHRGAASALRGGAVLVELVLHLAYADTQDLGGAAGGTSEGFHRLQDGVALELVHRGAGDARRAAALYDHGEHGRQV